MAVLQEGEAGGKGDEEGRVLEQERGLEAPARVQLPGFSAAPRPEQRALRGQGDPEPGDEAREVRGLQATVEKDGMPLLWRWSRGVPEGAYVRSSTRRT